MAKIALVTGAGHGIGKGEAIELAKAGYDVCISYCGSEEQAKDTVGKVRALGRRSMAIKADLTKLDDIDPMFDTLEREFGNIDVLVNNAGITKFMPFLEVSPEMFDTITNVARLHHKHQQRPPRHELSQGQRIRPGEGRGL